MEPESRGRSPYRTPAVRISWPLTVLGAMAGTLCVFMVLPLTQMATGAARKDLLLSEVGVAALPPPPPAAMEPEPPPPEPEEPEPPPQLSEQPMSFDLGDIDLDAGIGDGGVFGRGMAFGGEDALADVAIFDISDLDQRPRATSRIQPRYPPGLMKQRVEGAVVIVFVLDENGRVQDPRVESSTHPDFEQPALAALRRWRFQPGTREGEPVRSHVRQQIGFRINQ